jgi:hypothetical protein
MWRIRRVRRINVVAIATRIDARHQSQEKRPIRIAGQIDRIKPWLVRRSVGAVQAGYTWANRERADEGKIGEAAHS